MTGKMVWQDTSTERTSEEIWRTGDEQASVGEAMRQQPGYPRRK